MPGAELVASGKIVRRGKNVAHLFGEIIDGDGVVHANATGVWTIWNNKPQKFR